jgi:hypothetical protein
MFTWQIIAIIGRSTVIYQEKTFRIIIVNQQLMLNVAASQLALDGNIANNNWQQTWGLRWRHQQTQGCSGKTSRVFGQPP